MWPWLRDYLYFLSRCFITSFQGGGLFYAWMTGLTCFILVGLHAYCKQLVAGLAVTGMNDYVSWGLYIANFIYLVGMAAAAVMLVIPVYIYKKEDLHDVVIFGELFAIAAIIMCLLFVTVDLGRPDRFWHLIPFIGKFHWPVSMLSWDVIVLNVYLLLNMHICGYLLYMKYLGRKASRSLYIPFVFISIFWAVSIHTVTAFLLAGLGSRPFWNSAILGPRFIASAFAAGPAFIVLTLQVIRRFTAYRISDSALLMLRRIIQVAMVIHIFLLGNEIFKEFYTESLHNASSKYLFFGLHGHQGLVPWIWTALSFNMTAMILLMLPVTVHIRSLNIACILLVIGIWIEKGVGLIIPGFLPTPLGEIVEYSPTVNEILVCTGIWAFGLLLYTVLLRVSIPILTGRLRISGLKDASSALAASRG
jgi:molybdopterin-containing oxidoreductase family membrane subunit